MHYDCFSLSFSNKNSSVNGQYPWKLKGRMMGKGGEGRGEGEEGVLLDSTKLWGQDCTVRPR